MSNLNNIKIHINDKLISDFSNHTQGEIKNAVLYLEEKLNEIFTCEHENINDIVKVSLIHHAGLSINREIFRKCGGDDRSSEVYDDMR